MIGAVAGTPNAPSDADAIRSSRRDPRAFVAVFDRHFDAVYAYAQRRVGPELAEEVAAETFMRAFDRRRTFDVSRADARPWLLGIAANLLRRHWRTERRRLEAYGRAAAAAPSDSHPPGARADLAAALAELSEGDRAAILLFAWADLSYAEIAAALDVPIGTVRSRIARARRRLRERLGSDTDLQSRPAQESTHV